MVKNMEKKKKSKKWIWISIISVVLALILAWGIYHSFTFKDDSVSFNFGVFKITEVTALLFGIFIISLFGYLFGRIKIKGISFGTAGVFLVAILFGYLFTLEFLKDNPLLGAFYIKDSSSEMAKNYSDVVQNIGLILFISSVGFVAGPTFFSNLRKRGKLLILIVLSISITGAIFATLFALIPTVGPFFSVGVLAGANTTTPGFSSAIEAATSTGIEGAKDLVTLGYAVGYPFGVISIVLFVQVLPKILKKDLTKESKSISKKEEKTQVDQSSYIRIDPFGLAPLSLAIIIGLLIGSIKIPLTLSGFEGPCFSLGRTGGVLLTAVLIGHLGHIGKISLLVNEGTLKTFREFGLLLFLIGSGVSGGVALVEQITNSGGIILLYGVLGAIILSILPLVISFITTKFILKLNTVESLGFITGARTSTPALGMLIDCSKSDDVASLYASTYPIALIFVVVIPQLIISLLG